MLWYYYYTLPLQTQTWMSMQFENNSFYFLSCMKKIHLAPKQSEKVSECF